MTRRIIVAILRFAMRVYFRRVEVFGIENVPRKTPVIFVLNHPNALVDPAFLLSLAPRRVSFLAKSPLFGMPVLGYLVRAMDSLPVYRHQDEGEDVSKNREMFVAARKLLARGGAATAAHQNRSGAYCSGRRVHRRGRRSKNRSRGSLLHFQNKIS
jgi:1-acyl-sn-glycerol-3-phosphate acyltransferase